MSFNLAMILREYAASNPEHVLAYVDGGSLTYAEVDARSGRVSASFRALGLQPGDKIAVQLPNVEEFLVSYFAILKGGHVMVPLNPSLTSREVAQQLTDSDSKVLITSSQSTTSALAGANLAECAMVYVVGLPEATSDGQALSFAGLLEAPDDKWLHAASSDDTAVILFTSGTTGKPKGAELTHFQLYMNCTVVGSLLAADSEDKFVAALPLFHVFGLSCILNVTVRYGASLVLMRRFDAHKVVDIIEQHRATVFMGVPTMYVALLTVDAAGRDVSSLRKAVSGGASIPGEVIHAFEAKFEGVVILEGYGLSETAASATFNVDAERRKVLSIGQPIWGVEVRVVEPDGKELPPGAHNIGELVVRGHNVMKGYYKQHDATAAALTDGWFHTGDLGYRDHDGYLFVVDRLKDLVIRGGYNIYPREIEEVLYGHAEVLEAAVVGRPHDRLGEEVVAFIALRPGSPATVEELVAYCAERLASYKYPREIHLVSELPKGPTGKVLKRELSSKSRVTPQGAQASS